MTESQQPVSAAPASGGEALREQVVAAIKTCYDPEIPVDIWELGLVYDVAVAEDGNVGITMTLTSPMCPVAESLPPEVEAKVRAVPGVSDARVQVTWDPPWNPSMMTEAARLELGM
jgi:FeS assembly SUF system protein